MAYLHQVVNLGVVANARIAPRAAVDAGVGTELHAIAQHDAALLRLLGQLAGGRVHREAEAIRAQPHAVVQRAARSDRGVRQRAAVTHLRPLTQDDPRPNDAACAHATPGCDARPGKHDRAGLHYRAWVDRSIAVHQPAAVGPGSANTRVNGGATQRCGLHAPVCAVDAARTQALLRRRGQPAP